MVSSHDIIIRGCIKKFPDWPPGARTANGTAFCHASWSIAILWVSLLSFAAIALCVASQRMFIFCKRIFHYDSVRKLLDTASYISHPYNFLDFIILFPELEDCRLFTYSIPCVIFSSFLSVRSRYFSQHFVFKDPKIRNQTLHPHKISGMIADSYLKVPYTYGRKTTLILRLDMNIRILYSYITSDILSSTNKLTFRFNTEYHPPPRPHFHLSPFLTIYFHEMHFNDFCLLFFRCLM
jgi:hypothetical protein